MKVYVLGSGWAVPSKTRSKVSILVKDEYNILFDCGGDVSKGLVKSGTDLCELDALFLSHRHLDHLSGLTSLLHAIWLQDCEMEFPIYLNNETKEIVSKLIGLNGLDEKIDVKLKSIEGKGCVEELDISYSKVKHQVETHGFRYSDVCFSGDTKPCDNLIELANNSKLLLHEATYPSGMEEKAWENGHCTVKDAVNSLRKSNSSNLGIIHTSPKVDIDEEKNILDKDVFFPSDFTAYEF